MQSLSRFYKLTLSRKKGISTIAKEEEHVSIYVHLQNMRYHDSISFISDIPDELMEYQIPKLTLQPVVENSILHGILEKPSKAGTIVLTGWMEENDVVLLISDDGVGIAPDKLPVILSGDGTSVSGGPILPFTIPTEGFRFCMVQNMACPIPAMLEKERKFRSGFRRKRMAK